MLVQATTLIVVVRTAISVWPLRTVTRTLRQLALRFQSRVADPAAYRKQAAWASTAVGHRLLPNRPCLTQALVLQFMLLRCGDDAPELKIGVTKGQENELLAHAWVERDGVVLIGGESSPIDYQQFEGISDKIVMP